MSWLVCVAGGGGGGRNKVAGCCKGIFQACVLGCELRGLGGGENVGGGGGSIARCVIRVFFRHVS